MQPQKIHDIFNRTYNGERNFMTPSLIRYGQSGKFLYELSRGSGFEDNTIYGLTVLEQAPDKMIKTIKRPDLSECHHSLESAETAIKDLES